MGGDKARRFGKMRRHLRDDRALHRTDVGYDGAAFEMRRNGLRDRAASADRRANDDEIGAGDGQRAILGDDVGKAEFGAATDDLRR